MTKTEFERRQAAALTAEQRLELLNELCGEGTPHDSTFAESLGADYIGALDDGSIVAFGREFLDDAGHIARKLVVYGPDHAAQTIAAMRDASASAWQMAVETADSPKKEAATRAAETECDDAYADALAALEAGDLDECERQLRAAHSLEAEFGDSEHAARALEAIGVAL